MTPATIAILILAGIALTGALIGFVAGRLSAPARPRRKPVLFLSDAAIAHIAYEARRAYENALGIIRLKTWNNLTDDQRAMEARTISMIRQGKVDPTKFTSTAARLKSAIIDLAA